MDTDALVSIVVITYNSAPYIDETLNSIWVQTYPNIELVVSDDASTDDTLNIIKQWIKNNGQRFSKCSIVESPINTGITCNCNRGIAVAEGYYVKLVSGDDLIQPLCVERLVAYAEKNKIPLLYSKVLPFIDSTDQSSKIDLMKYDALFYEIFLYDAKKQYRKLLTGFKMYTIGLFFRKDFFESIGGFDEEYKMMEDYPFILKATGLGYKLQLLDEYLVHYRVRLPNLDPGFQSSKRKTVHTSDLRRFEEKELIPRLIEEKMYLNLYNVYVRRLASTIENTSGNWLMAYTGKIIGYCSTNKISSRIKMIKIHLYGQYIRK